MVEVGECKPLSEDASNAPICDRVHIINRFGNYVDFTDHGRMLNISSGLQGNRSNPPEYPALVGHLCDLRRVKAQF